jgi:phosphatidylglycerol:prolipoprotein diacylglycerol transferase
MAPTLFTLGRQPVSSYSVVMLVTLLAALGWLAWQQRRGRKDALDLGVLVLAAGVLGARAGHVLANWAYYGEQPAANFDLRDGGLSWHGGVLAGLAALALAAAWRHDRAAPYTAPLRDMLALLVVPVAIGLLGGWLACLLAGCAYGLPIAPPQRFYTPDWPDNYGVLAFRLPSQLLGMLLALLLLLLARPLIRRPGIFLILLGAGSFLIAWTRGDLPVSWGPLRATQWVDLVLILVGVALELASQRARRRLT